MKWQTSKEDLEKTNSLTKDNSGANLWVFLTGTTEGGNLGWAPQGTVCNWQTDNRNSINALHNGVIGTSLTVAHEVGHNLGMDHDFITQDKPRYYKGENCNKQGIMSYGDSRPKKWSKCSRNDFMAIYNHYISYGSDQWCLKSKLKCVKYKSHEMSFTKRF